MYRTMNGDPLYGILTQLFDGNSTDEDLKQICDGLGLIYHDEFNNSRPHYAIISKFVNNMYSEYGDDMILYRDYTKIDFIIEGIAMVLDFYTGKDKKEFGAFLDKITDHLTMEDDRALIFLDYKKLIEKSKESISKLDIRIQKFDVGIFELDSRTKRLDKSISKAVKAITNIKIENITILSIFTGIVMSGMGMLSLASNLFSGLSSENFYGLLAIGCFCGALIVLLVYIMIRYIGKIVFSADKDYENKIDWFIIVTTFLLVIFFCFFIHKYKF